jgi:hypothetical protein
LKKILEIRLYVVYYAQMPNKAAKLRKHEKKKRRQAIMAFKRQKKLKKKERNG